MNLKASLGLNEIWAAPGICKDRPTEQERRESSGFDIAVDNEVFPSQHRGQTNRCLSEKNRRRNYVQNFITYPVLNQARKSMGVNARFVSERQAQEVVHSHIMPLINQSHRTFTAENWS